MTSPRGPKEVQQLTGRITALARFISRSAHRSLPFFRTLRKAKKFEWGEDCEKAFGELKKYLAELPVLDKPMAGEGLWVYLSASEGSVSSVLVKKEGSTQKPIYYVSHALKGAELRYSGLEKLVLALVMTARRLRPYFLSHPIVVLTNSPLGRILTHPNVSGRLVKWVTELGEYDIQYEPRTAIKAQALTDFLTETVHLESEDPWKVFVDGSSSIEGSGVGVVLISPTSEEVKLTVKLDFKASNNEAEYEAVLAGLRATRNMGAIRIHVFFDSQLVAQKMKGEYDVKNEMLIEYAREVDKAKKQFAEVVFEQILRRENERAEALAKMAGSMGSWKTRDVVFQVELAPHMSPVIPELAEEDWRVVIINYLEGKLPEDPKEAQRPAKSNPTLKREKRLAPSRAEQQIKAMQEICPKVMISWEVTIHRPRGKRGATANQQTQSKKAGEWRRKLKP
ncbi:uncharacterized protein [Henckelia pumila]|uniref:uncharacterized protein n=1 Tax=Henckelia pumila TaxID=405737 RepID=UPI003C6E0D1E